MPFKTWMKQTHNSLVKENQGRVSLFVGRKGAGKSLSTISLADGLLDGKFDVKKSISYFEPWKFVSLLETAKGGDVLILDDAGLAIGAREWNTRSNIYLSHIFQTCRTTNTWILISTPDLSFIDKNLRTLLDDYIIVKGYDRKTEKTLLDWRIPNRNYFDGSVFWNQLKIKGRTFGRLYLNKPQEDKVKLYEKTRAKAWRRIMKRAEDVKTGKNKGITLQQAGSLCGIPVSKLSEMLAAGQIPQHEESETLKVPLSFITDVVKVIGNLKGKNYFILSKKQLKKYPSMKATMLGTGEFLACR